MVIDEIVDGFQSMFQYTVRRLRADVTAKLAAAGVDVNSILGLDDLFEQVPQPFEELETRHKQEKYFRETLGLVVSNYYYHSPTSAIELSHNNCDNPGW